MVTGYIFFEVRTESLNITKTDCSQVPSCYCMLAMQPSLRKFIKITPLLYGH
jgi:hypothetical protein